MTGQVKEELITRFGELGLVWEDGQLEVIPGLLRSEEFLAEPNALTYLNVDNQWQTVDLASGSLAFTMAQVPFVYRKADALAIRVVGTDGKISVQTGATISAPVVAQLVSRSGEISRIEVDFPISG
jgi:hypothetical protein